MSFLVVLLWQSQSAAQRSATRFIDVKNIIYKIYIISHVDKTDFPLRIQSKKKINIEFNLVQQLTNTNTTQITVF